MIIDGNEAAAYVSYAFSELAIIYPITPSSPMAELADIWQAQGKTNLFDSVPKIVQMQSESGVAGALHGALTCGALATTYTSSQGLLLMVPDMYKIAGELLPTVIHVSARAIATHALNIFGDHQDVMSARQTGFAMLCSSSVQECMDLAVVAHLATLKSSVPFLHFFDGFRTSHELTKIDALESEELRSLIDTEEVARFRARALSPDSPICRGTTQNGDIYFQNRERANPYYLATPTIVQETMDRLAKITKRQYHIFDYVGNCEAEYVVVVMGSAASAMEKAVKRWNEEGKKTGIIKVRLYRPFDALTFSQILPKTCKRVGVLDRAKEPGAVGEPLYLDVCAALKEMNRENVEVFGGRYGLGGKDFAPCHGYAVFENLFQNHPKNHFTVGIDDDVTGASLPLLNDCIFQSDEFLACKFYGLGSDGTVGANKNSIKIVGEYTKLFVQGFFVYDSKKSGGVTISHVRFIHAPIQASYLIKNPHFVACHDPSYLSRYDMLSDIQEKGVFLLNCPHGTIEELNAHLPHSVKRKIAQKELSFYVIDATKIAKKVGLHGRTSTIMQAAFFFLNPALLPYEEAISLLKKEIPTI